MQMVIKENETEIVKSDLKTQSRKLQIYAVNNKPTLYIKTYIG